MPNVRSGAGGRFAQKLPGPEVFAAPQPVVDALARSVLPGVKSSVSGLSARVPIMRARRPCMAVRRGPRGLSAAAFPNPELVALRLALKPHERLIVGGAVLRNGDTRTELMIENKVPVLRERDILSPNTATTPCGMIYLTLQLMYVEPQSRTQQRTTYDTLTRDVLTAAPSTRALVSRITARVDEGEFYQALKVGRELLTYEHSLLAHAHERA